ncbi:MAG: L-lactate permease [Gemmatimonadaceae bacterium]|nr:L-lactate permease [Gemmatimonadaceae bacterium]
MTSALVGKQLPLFAMIIPFWLIWVMAGWRSVKRGTVGVSGGRRELWRHGQYFISNHFGPILVDLGVAHPSCHCWCCW